MTLHLALPMDRHGGHTGTPVVDGDRLFVVTPFPHCVLAVDLTRTDAPVLWHYSPHADGMAAGLTSRDTTTGGIALSSGRVFLNTFDGHTIALDAAMPLPAACCGT